MRQACIRLAKFVWASPNTGLGAVLGLGVILLGGHIRVASGAVEFSGGLLERALIPAPRSFPFRAITFGHVIVGINETELDKVRLHEHVHIRQYERWGPFFLPAYALSSLWQALQGRSVYRDNRFEREAFGIEHSHATSLTPHQS